MFNPHSIGANHESCKADFGDQMRHMKEQGYVIAEDLLKAVKLLVEYFPKRSPLHNGLEIEARGDMDDVQGSLTITIRTLRISGGM